ncbi:hypothetical protein FoTM2_015149 [Fusarium oxysporum f. sp. vasinfectum]|uniref:Uncharacterized protein n=1 Tax=Fusarium oxysporum f. sp. vasinfectum 25433 TaxID=1089449 RepID=X0LBI0_FUSOX|nr:hypothetical protein FOTG_13607 [Fusarium oxysporum f. sp. vasinfectum 25433]KAK2690918.1 hypothetical protein QWA68_010416 [Fusarium oxysporum]KAK2924871.1 hypothetical protein FoTM2_015149 [Fusarium oxysporum f. sp. vasinfectum]
MTASQGAKTNGSYFVVLSAIVVVSEEAMDDDSVSPAEADENTVVGVTDSVSTERIVEDKTVEVAGSVVIELADDMSVLVVSASLELVVLIDVTELGG